MHGNVIHFYIFKVCDVICYIRITYLKINKRVCFILYLTYCGHVGVPQ